MRPRIWLLALLASACGDDLRVPCADCAAADAGRDAIDAGPLPAVCDDGNACTSDLAFDGTVAYLTQLHIEPGNAFYQLLAATFGAPGPPAAVEVNATARSLVPIDTGLAIGFDTQLLTVRPYCP